MRYRKLTSNGDYCFGGGQQDFMEGTAAVAQAVQTRLRLFAGEWWENIELGVPFFQEILGQRGTAGNIQTIDLLLRDTILGTPGVTALNKVESSFQTAQRRYAFSAEIQTEYGTTALEGVI